jgi:hypothetical protein
MFRLLSHCFTHIRRSDHRRGDFRRDDAYACSDPVVTTVLLILCFFNKKNKGNSNLSFHNLRVFTFQRSTNENKPFVCGPHKFVTISCGDHIQIYLGSLFSLVEG